MSLDYRPGGLHPFLSGCGHLQRLEGDSLLVRGFMLLAFGDGAEQVEACLLLIADNPFGESLLVLLSPEEEGSNNATDVGAGPETQGGIVRDHCRTNRSQNQGTDTAHEEYHPIQVLRQEPTALRRFTPGREAPAPPSPGVTGVATGRAKPDG